MRVVLIKLTMLAVLSLSPGLASAADSPSPELAAQAARRGFEDVLQSTRQSWIKAGPSESVAGELARRADLDRKARKAYTRMLSPEPAMVAARTAARADLIQMDTDNAAYLSRTRPTNGWFAPQKVGEVAFSNAWLLVQHSPDLDLMAAALAGMGPDVQRHPLHGREYALLYDRYHLLKGEPQRFGTQFSCIDGKWAFHPIEAVEQVDVRRRAVGFPDTLQESVASFPMFGQACAK